MRLPYEVVIALGSNQGSSIQLLRQALTALQQNGIQVLRHSSLYESDPKYETDQPAFVNAAVLGQTQHAPLELLDVLKRVEAEAGRDFKAKRFGPRTLDLDIIFYGSTGFKTQQLEIPHPRWQERSFVLAPLSDLHRTQPLAAASDSVVSSTHTSHFLSQPPVQDNAVSEPSDLFGRSTSVQAQLQKARSLWAAMQINSPNAAQEVRRILAVRNRRWLLGSRSFCMGILNVTPDSFSDGSLYNSQEAAVQQAIRLVQDGADIIDIGGQSTRPGATMLSDEEEMARVIPVIDAIRSTSTIRDIPLSIDTFQCKVAAAAVKHGADMVNDVSGGKLDDSMHSTVAGLGVPYVLMHMRGTPSTMQSSEHTQYGDVVSDVAAELISSSEQAVAAGIPEWDLVLDPGVGFSKTKEGNVELIRNLKRLKEEVAVRVGYKPILVGPSRKRFLGTLTGRPNAADRDAATVAAAVGCVASGADIVRAHNVAMVSDGLKVADAIFR